MKLFHGFALLLSITLPWAATAEPLTYDRIALSATAGEEVENDTLKAVMHVQREGKDSARLSNEVNRAITSAVRLAKQREGIKVSTLDYTTSPVYHKQTITGWRVRQSISLESRDSTQLSQLVGTLQKQLDVSSISYTLSPEGRQQVENRLISDALTAFEKRAKLVSREMGRSGYRLVTMNINSGGRQPPRPIAMRAMAMDLAKSAAPTLEAGTQRVNVSINGTIELLP